MKRIDPVGRKWQEENVADYSTLSTRCKCASASLYARSQLYGPTCYCGSDQGTVSTRINVY